MRTSRLPGDNGHCPDLLLQLYLSHISYLPPSLPVLVVIVFDTPPSKPHYY